MKRALVIDGSAGIGVAICRALLAADYVVGSLDRQPAAPQTLFVCGGGRSLGL